MGIRLAEHTMQAIEKTMEADQGAAFRQHLGRIIPHMSDAYRGSDEAFRTHLGASMLGGECARALWYGFRWATRPSHSGRILRLFNRGHLEEARFIAMLLTIGCTVYQQDANGNQFRISDAGGHLGGSTDGVVVGVPDLPEGMPALTEFKTHGEKSFLKLKKEGVKSAKFEHYVQMQLYMLKLKLTVALYMAVNKNTDEVYAEIVLFDSIIAERYLDRGIQLVFTEEAPKKLNESPGWFECSFCDHKKLCHLRGEPDKNCRTCEMSFPKTDGTWICRIHDAVIPKEVQLRGCPSWQRKSSI